MEFNREWVPPILVGAASFAAGIAVGYFISKKSSKVEEITERVEQVENQQLEFQFEKENRDFSFNSLYLRADERLEEISQQIWERDKAGIQAVEEAEQAARERHPAALIQAQAEEDQGEQVNVFVVEDGWDYGEEEKHRSPDRPYIIHRDEYFSNEMELDQSTLEYYAGDHILCDENDVPLYDADKIVGENNLQFGKGSHDISIVYIRNEALGAEWEVLLNEGTFLHEVLGEEAEGDGEVKHSLHKFRSD